MDNENARLRALLRKCRPSVANMAYGWLEDDALVKEIDAALTPAPEAPKDGEGLPGVMPRYFAVQSVTGVHIGMWENGKIASEVLSEYPGGKIIEMVDVHAVPRATPSPGADFRAGLLRAGKRYRDGNGEVKGPLHAIWWENGEEMLTDSYVVWHPDGTLAGGTREDKRSLVAEVGDSNA